MDLFVLKNKVSRSTRWFRSINHRARILTLGKLHQRLRIDLEEAHRFRVVTHQEVFSLLVMIKHHFMVFTANP